MAFSFRLQDRGSLFRDKEETRQFGRPLRKERVSKTALSLRVVYGRLEEPDVELMRGRLRFPISNARIAG